jgi:hypothetical protein
MTSASSTLWVAYGTDGNVVGTVRKSEGYTPTVAGATASVGTYPSMEVASALHSHLAPGSDWPQFRQH